MDSMLQEIRKVLMAGLGLMDYSLEKAQKAIDQLAKRGEITAEQARQLSNEITQKIKDKVSDSCVGDWFTEKGRQQSVIRDLEDMSDSARRAVRSAIDEMLGRNDEKDEAQDGCCCGCGNPKEDCCCDADNTPEDCRCDCEPPEECRCECDKPQDE